MLSRGGFRLTKFTSNWKSFLSTVPSERKSLLNWTLTRINYWKLPSKKAFEVRWFVETEEVGFEIRDLNCPETKRGILSAICSLYDLLGFPARETITATTWDQAQFSFRFVTNIPAGKAKRKESLIQTFYGTIDWHLPNQPTTITSICLFFKRLADFKK